MNEPIASYIDHTLLKPTSTDADIDKLCREATEFGFAAVCVPPFVVKRTAEILEGTPVKTATVIGFPMGYSSTGAKLAETSEAITDGADELDVVINIMALKNGAWSFLEKEILQLVAIIHDKSRIIKVIVESGVLSRDELIRCCDLYGRAGIDFMKTSTGYAEKGASVSDVKLMRSHLPVQIRIKASGGIRHYAFAKDLIEAGADRLGCSASLQILDEEKLASLKEKSI